MKNERDRKNCEKCGQPTPLMNLFLCAGKMRCEGCYMQKTRGNTVFFNNADYPRDSKITEEEVEDSWKNIEANK
jgi:NAD-dependent SIR2 family protein deacetylase